MSGTESLKKGGKRGPAIVPGKAEESLLYEAVTRKGDLKMPPSGLLAEREIEIIRKWIESGAVWPDRKSGGLWAYRPISKPLIPEIDHPEWAANEIDAFIVAGY